MNLKQFKQQLQQLEEVALKNHNLTEEEIEVQIAERAFRDYAEKHLICKSIVLNTDDNTITFKASNY
jgi:hypothetical protein